MEENILKVISPLTAEFIPDRWSGEDEIQDLDGRGLMPYREQIEQTAAEQAVDFLAYYDGPEEKSGKTLSASSRRLRCGTEGCAAVRPSRIGRTCPNTSGTYCSGRSRASIRMVGAKGLSRGILKWMEAF